MAPFGASAYPQVSWHLQSRLTSLLHQSVCQKWNLIGVHQGSPRCQSRSAGESINLPKTGVNNTQRQYTFIYIAQLHETSDAVVYLHRKNIVHGDIKASNLLISDGGHILLCDFGLAKSTYAQTSTALKGAGTFRWQSPELWDNEPRTFASDVYAFSMTIVEVMDHQPFNGSRSILRKHARFSPAFRLSPI